MASVLDYPLGTFLLSLSVLWLSVQIGSFVARKLRPVDADEREDLTLVITASLTLLALIIGFSFSVAASRYEQRKNYEEEEANAIGTEYLRADLLQPANAAKVRVLLKQYLDQRLLFYTTRDKRQLEQIDKATAQIQSYMWSTVQSEASANPTCPVALVVSGMNDVLNRQGYTQAAWWYRIPEGAWILMFFLAICCSGLIGYGARRREDLLFSILPFLVAVAFFFIADIDSPRSGLIRVAPQNLISLSQSLH